MRITHNPENNVGYIYLKEGAKVARTEEFKDINLDFATDGTIIGIELMDANRQLGNSESLTVEKNNKPKDEVRGR